MDISNSVKKLKNVNYALNLMEVKGRSNMDILLGSMQAIDQVIAVLEKVEEDACSAPEISIEAVEG